MGPKKPRDPDAFPTWQLTVLAICRFSEPIAFNSILAYAYAMVEDLRGTAHDASFFAGLLVSGYAVAEAITCPFWGMLSDRYGRKPIVLIGLAGVAVSSLIFGLAKSYWVALLARFVGGALNGNVAVMQTMVAEMVKKPEHEPKAYAVQPFVWTLGGIIGSAMGGFLAQPTVFYPSIFPADGLFGKYPYLMPNIVAVVVIVLAIIQGAIFLEETNPNELVSDDDAIDTQSIMSEHTPMLRAPRASVSMRRRSMRPSELHSARPPRPSFVEEGLPGPMGQMFDLRRTSFGTMHSLRLQPAEVANIRREAAANRPARPVVSRRGTSRVEGAAFKGTAFNYTVVMLIAALTIISYHSMAFISILPVHLLDKPLTPLGQLDMIGGLGYTVHDVGIYLAINGVISLFIQGTIFPFFVDKVGIWKSLVWMVVLFPIPYMIMPFLSALPFTQLFVYLALVLQSFFGIIVYPVALIMLKDATPSSQVLGKVNGAAMSACCLARTVSPPLVGVIYSAGGSAAAWFSCAGVAVLGIAQLFFIPRKNMGHVEVDSALLAKTDTDGTTDHHAEA
ncbi:hypothetical protein B0A48_16034 [Cryoendolithus antarcticus]|uniref:Major facilitator superfamily (MFS) profile domain-containing protein n=1 Tax=Cryoendolithus antarcticus TaxID=1507870 RepID=A0A1V8SEY1_9PEZI|nr:hypothetical protein B0A48_16034 [Cryoendolithus antarcticus]